MSRRAWTGAVKRAGRQTYTMSYKISTLLMIALASAGAGAYFCGGSVVVGVIWSVVAVQLIVSRALVWHTREDEFYWRGVKAGLDAAPDVTRLEDDERDES